jgi:hypothetical protein
MLQQKYIYASMSWYQKGGDIIYIVLQATRACDLAHSSANVCLTHLALSSFSTISPGTVVVSYTLCIRLCEGL